MLNINGTGVKGDENERKNHANFTQSLFVVEQCYYHAVGFYYCTSLILNFDAIL